MRDDPPGPRMEPGWFGESSYLLMVSWFSVFLGYVTVCENRASSSGGALSSSGCLGGRKFGSVVQQPARPSISRLSQHSPFHVFCMGSLSSEVGYDGSFPRNLRGGNHTFPCRKVKSNQGERM